MVEIKEEVYRGNRNTSTVPQRREITATMFTRRTRAEPRLVMRVQVDQKAHAKGANDNQASGRAGQKRGRNGGNQPRRSTQLLAQLYETQLARLRYSPLASKTDKNPAFKCYVG